MYKHLRTGKKNYCAILLCKRVSLDIDIIVHLPNKKNYYIKEECNVYLFKKASKKSVVSV